MAAGTHPPLQRSRGSITLRVTKKKKKKKKKKMPVSAGPLKSINGVADERSIFLGLSHAMRTSKFPLICLRSFRPSRQIAKEERDLLTSLAV